jgi:hypothetical protein
VSASAGSIALSILAFLAWGRYNDPLAVRQAATEPKTAVQSDGFENRIKWLIFRENLATLAAGDSP